MRSPLALLRSMDRNGQWVPVGTSDAARGIRANAIVWVRRPSAKDKEVIRACMAHVPIHKRNEFTLDEMVRTCSASTSTGRRRATRG